MALKSFSHLSLSNYLALDVFILGLYINYFAKVLYILCYSLFRNFKYPLLAYYAFILLLNFI